MGTQLFTDEELQAMGLDATQATTQEVETIPDAELLVVKKQEVAEYRDIKIESQEGLTTAGTLLVKCKTSIKEIKARLEAAVEPFKQEKKSLDAKIKTTSEPYQVVMAALEAMRERMDALILGYNKRLRAQIAEQQRKEDEKFEKKVEKAIEKSEAKGMPVVMPKAKVIEAPNLYKEIGVQVRKLQTYTIPGVIVEGKEIGEANLRRTNPKLAEIPDCYWVLDTKGLAQAHRSKGCEIAGTIHTVKEITA